jgi:hypothetical protein
LVAASEAAVGVPTLVIRLLPIDTVCVEAIVKPFNVPTEVRDEAVTPELRVEPVRVPAAAVTVMLAEPSNEVPLIVLAVASVVAVPALPLTEPVIGLVTVRFARVPTEVRDEAVTPELSVEPVRVPAAAVTVIAAEPSKFTPLIARGVARAVAVEALPVSAPTNVEEVTEERPAIVVVVLPSEMLVLPRVNDPPPVEIVCQPVLSRYFSTFSVESY